MNDNHILDSYFRDLKVLPVPNNPAVQEGVITLSGGFDFQRRQLIVFPIVMHLKIQMIQVSPNQLVDALLYYFEIITKFDKKSGIAFLVDFRAGSSVIIKTIVSALNEFQIRTQNSESVLYAIQPQNQGIVNEIKTYLKIKSLRSENTDFRHKEIKIFFVKNSLELYQHIDRKYLTSEFGGCLQYNHNTWLLLQTNIEGCLKKIKSVEPILPEVVKKILRIKEFNLDDKKISPVEVTNLLQKQFDDIIKTSRINEFIKEIDLLSELTSSFSILKVPPKYKLLKGNPGLENSHLAIIKIRKNLIEIENYLQKVFKKVKSKFDLGVESSSYNKHAVEAVYWIREIGSPYLHSNPKIALDSDEADSIAREFHNKVYIPGIKCLSKCDNFCTLSTINNCSSIDLKLSSIGNKMTNIITKFNNELQRRRKLYSDVYQFHLILNQICSWMNKTIKRLPIESIEYAQNMNSDDLIMFSLEWKAKIRQHLIRHPSPKSIQIKLIEERMKIMNDINLRSKSQFLLYRFNIIMKLINFSNVTVQEFREVIDWKYQLQLDLSLEDNKHEKKSQHNFFNMKTDNFMTLKNNQMEKKRTPSEFINSTKYLKPFTTVTQKVISNEMKESNIINPKIFISRSQPILTTEKEETFYYKNKHKNEELIELAERTVKESLRSAEIISEKDLRIPKFQNDEDELSLILNQLLYDINSTADSTSDYLSSHLFEMNDSENDLS